MIQFDREAPTLDAAIRSAVRDVEQSRIEVARIQIERHEMPQGV